MLLLHQAFRAFITDRKRCTDDRFYVDMAVDYTQPIFEVGLKAMNCFIVCRLEDTSLLNSELTDTEERINRFIPAPLLYASRHWVDHLLHVQQSERRVLDELFTFLFMHLLHWIELSSLTGQVDTALASLKVVLEWLKVCVGDHDLYAYPHTLLLEK